ncbi:uncharacterized protein [Leptinotarsa decemlineata]|uniref:uncharacterized protein n=1 Tax=Leptinotarsa decemlineata TaxID=7539 RepID=UPI003D30BE9D
MDNVSVLSFASSSKKRRLNDGFPPLPDVSRRRIDEWTKTVVKEQQPKPAKKMLKKLKKKAALDNVREEARKYYSESETSSHQIAENQASEVATSSKPNTDVEMDTNAKTPTDSASEKSENTVKSLHDEETTPPTPLKQDIPSSASKAKIPPIVVRQKDKWVPLLKLTTRENIKFSKAVNLHDGIKVQPESPDDYRRLARLLVREKIPHHTYSLPEERQLRAVIRGVPEHLATSDVREELESKGFDLTSVTRMKRAGKPMPLVLVLLDRDQKHIFEVKDLLCVKVQVEPQHAKTSVGQCHRCQRFGHCQRNCLAVPICVKCAGRHLTSACKKTKADPPKCNNCKGAHTANYRGCPAYPKVQKKGQTTTRKPASSGRPAGSGRVQEGVSFAKAASKGASTASTSAKPTSPRPEPSPQTQGVSDICAALDQMKKLFVKFPVLQTMFTVNTSVMTGTANV